MVLIQILDIDEYLPPDTLNWCHTRLLEMGFHPKCPPTIDPAERFTPFHTVYLQFRDVISAHLTNNADPVLALSEPPQLGDWNSHNATSVDN